MWESSCSLSWVQTELVLLEINFVIICRVEMETLFREAGDTSESIKEGAKLIDSITWPQVWGKQQRSAGERLCCHLLIAEPVSQEGLHGECQH